VTAHTRDDQAETVLMRLAAGSGPSGLAGMRPMVARGGLSHVRPLLTVPKARLVATLRAAGIGWSEDPMNEDPAFARPRLRAARAALAREGLTDARLATLAARMARLEAAVEDAVAAAWGDAGRMPDGSVIWPPGMLSALPAEVGLRLIGRAVATVGDQARVRLERLEALAIAMNAAAAARTALVRTLGGARVALARDGSVTVSAAPPRRAVNLRGTTLNGGSLATTGNAPTFSQG
jgi:tRNA(Ile)-lysidine synthase